LPKELKKIQSVERSFLILEVLSVSETPLSLLAISQATGISKTTVHGLLGTMSALGYISRVKQKYTLGLRLRELSRPLEQKDEYIGRHFSPLLKRMAEMTNNTAYLAVQSGTQEYLYIDVIERDNSLKFKNLRGRREGLTTSAIGKVFLAFDTEIKRSLRLAGKLSPKLENELEKILTRGYALDIEEAEPNLNCMAIPLYIEGKLTAVAGISGPSDELDQARLKHFASVFLKT